MDQFIRKIRFYINILFDRETPWYVKILLAIGLIYLVYPLDFIPDQIPLLGMVDDLTIGAFLIGLAIRLVPASVIRRIQTKFNEDV